MPPAATMATRKKDNIMIAQRPNFEYDLEDRQEETLDPVRLEHNNSVATPHDRYHLLMAFSGDNLPIGPMVGFMPRSRARDAAVRYMEQRRRLAPDGCPHVHGGRGVPSRGREGAARERYNCASVAPRRFLND